MTHGLVKCLSFTDYIGLGPSCRCFVAVTCVFLRMRTTNHQSPPLYTVKQREAKIRIICHSTLIYDALKMDSKVKPLWHPLSNLLADFSRVVSLLATHEASQHPADGGESALPATSPHTSSAADYRECPSHLSSPWRGRTRNRSTLKGSNTDSSEFCDISAGAHPRVTQLTWALEELVQELRKRATVGQERCQFVEVEVGHGHIFGVPAHVQDLRRQHVGFTGS